MELIIKYLVILELLVLVVLAGLYYLGYLTNVIAYYKAIPSKFLALPWIARLSNSKFALGLRAGYNYPVQSPVIIKISSLPLFRVFRVLGWLSTFVLLAHISNHITLPFWVIILSTPISFIWFFWLIVVSFNSLYLVIRAFVRGDFIFRNSPMSWMGSLGKGFIIAAKGLPAATKVVAGVAPLIMSAEYFTGYHVVSDYTKAQSGRVLGNFGIPTETNGIKKELDTGSISSSRTVAEEVARLGTFRK